MSSGWGYLVPAVLAFAAAMALEAQHARQLLDSLDSSDEP
jgi:hypothetical protein